MLSAWPPVTASCATASNSASTDAESLRFELICLCYISPTIVGTSAIWPLCCSEPDVPLVSVATSPVHSGTIGSCRGQGREVKTDLSRVKVVPVPPAAPAGHDDRQF